MVQSLLTALRRAARALDDERGEVNVSMIAWMVVTAAAIFAFRTQLAGMLSAAITFVTNTLGI